MKSFLSRPYLTLLWTAVVLVLTLTPAAEMPETPEWKLLSFDTAGHAGVFAVLAGLAWFWARARVRRPGAVVLLGCVLLGAAIEVVQYAMHAGRHAEWTDLLADGIGAVLALLLLNLGQRSYRRLTAATAALLLAGPVAHAQPAAPAAAPDLARARRTIEALAAPAMHGRGYVQQGEHVAAAYLRGRLQALGLQPLAPDYTQPFTLDVNTFPGVVKLQLSRSRLPQFGKQYLLQPGRDFIAAPISAGGSSGGYQPVCYLDSATLTTPARLAYFLQFIHHPCIVVVADRYAQQLTHQPAAVSARLDSAVAVIKVVPKLTASLAPQQGATIQLEALPNPLFSFVPNTPVTTAASAGIVQLDAQLLRNYQTQNLAAVVRGNVRPDSFVVVTAHYDHLGMMGKDVYFPGANDNASGVALLLELAAHYARPENQPACSVAFLLFGAEEAGLLGSSYFVQHPLLPLPRIKFLVNLDLLGTGEEGATVVNGRVYEAAYQRLLALNATHHYLPRLTARGRAANSDHFPFSEAGVPAFFMYTRGGSLAYHDVHDQPAALSLAGFAGAYGLVRDFLNATGAAPVQ